jgi:excisionase family DNA binding protein
MTASVEPIVYSVPEAARLLCTTESAARNHVQKRRLAVIKVGRRIYIEREEILAFLRQRIVR